MSNSQTTQRHRLEDREYQLANLTETQLEEKESSIKQVSAIGLTLDAINRNKRLYTRSAGEQAVKKLKQRINTEGFQLVGRIEHQWGGARADNVDLIWDEVELEYPLIKLSGRVIETATGKDLVERLRAELKIGVSQVAYGESEFREINGEQIEVVTDFEIELYDVVLRPSDPNGEMERKFESRPDNSMMEEIMPDKAPPADKLLTMEGLRQQHPELVAQLLEAEQEKQAEAEAALQKQLTEAEEKLKQQFADDKAAFEKALLEEHAKLRAAAGAGDEADLEKLLTEQAEKVRQFEEAQRRQALEALVNEGVATLNYPGPIKQTLAEAAKQGLSPQTTEDEVKALLESKRKEYDALMSQAELRGKGFEVKGPVMEQELGVPEFARLSHELSESIALKGVPMWDAKKPLTKMTKAELFTQACLEQFDKMYGRKLRQESETYYSEAQTTSDMAFPASASRTVIQAALPRLVAAELFALQTLDAPLTSMPYDRYVPEIGAEVSVSGTPENVTAKHDEWVNVAGARVRFGTVVVKEGANTRVFGGDYVFNHTEGKIKTLSTGTITDGATLELTYDYDAVRKGEMQPVERAKLMVDKVTVEAVYDRLATEISREAVQFAQGQIGFDSRGRVLQMLAQQIRIKIDAGIFATALDAVVSVPSNKAGTYSLASNNPNALATLIRKAIDMVSNHYYEPTFTLMRNTIASHLSEADGFNAKAARPDFQLLPNSMIGLLHGLPSYKSTEFFDSYILVGNEQLVLHGVHDPLNLSGPFASYDTGGKLLDAEQWMMRESNATRAPVPEKGAYVEITA